MARPISRSISLKDGYYIEVRHKGEPKGVKIRRDTYDQIQIAIKKYETIHEVIYIGKVKNGQQVKK